MIKGPGPGANVDKYKNNLQQIIKNRKIYINLDEFLKNRNKNFNYTVWNNKLVGFALLKPNKNILNLELIVTQKGYGKQLINRIKLNSKNKFKYIELVSLPAARNFYIKQGFVKNGNYKFKFNLKK